MAGKPAPDAFAVPRQRPRARGGSVVMPASKPATLNKPQPVSGLDDGDRALLGEALRALRCQRGAAWNAACDATKEQGRRLPSPRAFGIEDIRRLARRLGIRATHWLEK